MFEREIEALDRQGLTSGTIARTLGMSVEQVRRVLNTASVAESKPVYDGALDEWRQQRAERLAAEKKAAKTRRAKAEAKRAKALVALAEASAALNELQRS